MERLCHESDFARMVGSFNGAISTKRWKDRSEWGLQYQVPGCFNGAISTKRWKDLFQRRDSPIRCASMGPSQRRDGKKRHLDSSCVRRNRLQWGHLNEEMERRTPSDRRFRPTRCFNGAISTKRWKDLHCKMIWQSTTGFNGAISTKRWKEGTNNLLTCHLSPTLQWGHLNEEMERRAS